MSIVMIKEFPNKIEDIEREIAKCEEVISKHLSYKEELKAHMARKLAQKQGTMP